MTAPTRKLSREQRQQLRMREKLTDVQIKALERAVVNLAGDLERSATLIDVRDELSGFNKHMQAAAKYVVRWQRAKRPAAGAEALGHLNMAGAQVGRVNRPDDGTWPEYLVGAEVVKLCATVAAQALANCPTKKRAPSRASWMAIDEVREALERPDDPESRSACAALPITRTEPRKPGPSFWRVAKIAFAAATGDPDANPERSIREYMERRAQRG